MGWELMSRTINVGLRSKKPQNKHFVKNTPYLKIFVEICYEDSKL